MLFLVYEGTSRTPSTFLLVERLFSILKLTPILKLIGKRGELELELILSHMAQKQMLRGEVDREEGGTSGEGRGNSGGPRRKAWLFKALQWCCVF